jgi:hypothetical protein
MYCESAPEPYVPPAKVWIGLALGLGLGLGVGLWVGLGLGGLGG